MKSVWPLEVLQATNINRVPSCGWTMNLDMVLGSSTHTDVTMTLVGSTGLSDKHKSNVSMATESNMAPGVGPNLEH